MRPAILGALAEAGVTLWWDGAIVRHPLSWSARRTKVPAGQRTRTTRPASKLTVRRASTVPSTSLSPSSSSYSSPSS